MKKRKGQEQETTMNIVQPTAPPLSPELIARFRKIVGDSPARWQRAVTRRYYT